MSETGKVMDPKTEDLISGDQDIGFLEGQVKKIMDNTLRIYIRNQTVGSIILIGMGIIFLLLLYAAPDNIKRIILLVGGTILIVFGVIYHIVCNINFKYLPYKEIRNVRDWKKFLDSKEGTAISAEIQGRLEVLMRMVASMGGWLHAEKFVEEITIGILSITIFLPVSILFIIGLMFKLLYNVFLVIYAAGLFGYMAILFGGHHYVNKKYVEKQNYWGPRLMIYRARLDGYWGRL
jgi:hypothetical protein